jgi:hypothetical protein
MLNDRWIILWCFLGVFCVQCGGQNSSDQHRTVREVVQKGGKLAQKYCTTCHSFSKPQALPRDIWGKRVLPNMGRRLGMKRHSIIVDYPPIDSSITPETKQLTQQEWDDIVYYYIQKSPEKLNTRIREYPDISSTGFNLSNPDFNYPLSPVISYLNIDEVRQEIILGDALANKLLFFDYDLNLLRKLETSSPVVDLSIVDGVYYATTIGIMAPNDQKEGQIIRYDFQNDRTEIIADSLRRPVFKKFHDFNGDDLKDILVCEYGNNLGELSLFIQEGRGTFKKSRLIRSPGALKIIINDFNRDGKDDFLALFAQGNERIDLFLNQGDAEFNRKTLLQFPPEYGSYDLHYLDLNGNGRKELLYVGGDNGDYSNILKPYHGLRIFVRKENEEIEFKEEYFFPLHGASKLTLFDYDKDGDQDIGITSTFPGNGEQKGPGFVFLENNSTSSTFLFQKYQVEQSIGKPWTLISSGDLDRDGDVDLLAGAMNLMSYRKFQQSGDPYADSTKSVLLLLNSVNSNK